MSTSPLTLEFSFFEKIHINQQGAVIYGYGRSVFISACFFNEISTGSGGSCVDLNNSAMNLSSSCFSNCKNTHSSDDSFANIIKFYGTLLKISKITSLLCSDSTIKAGDSSIYASSSDLNLSDSNATSNLSPSGSSSLRADIGNNQKKVFVKRSIDINSAKYSVIQASAPLDVSHMLFLNTTNNQYILACSNFDLCWCIYINQCQSFSYNFPKSAVNCYSDEKRSELSSTTSIFEIQFANIDLHQCQKNIKERRKECIFTNGNFVSNAFLLIFSFFSLSLSFK